MLADIGWDMASDMWSLGCILMELYTGDVLFRTHEHLEHLAMMVRMSPLISIRHPTCCIENDYVYTTYAAVKIIVSALRLECMFPGVCIFIVCSIIWICMNCASIAGCSNLTVVIMNNKDSVLTE